MSYFRASNVDIGDIATQQNFLCSAIDDELVKLMKQHINPGSSVEDSIATVKDIFLDNYPLFTRY